MWTTRSTERLSRSNLTTLHLGVILLFLASVFPRVCLCFVKDTNLSGLFARRISFSVSRNVLLYQQGIQGQRLPLIAVVREVGLDQAVDFALSASDAGFKMISVTVDTPEYPRVLNAMVEAVGNGTGERLMFGVSSATSRNQVVNQANALVTVVQYLAIALIMSNFQLIMLANILPVSIHEILQAPEQRRARFVVNHLGVQYLCHDSNLTRSDVCRRFIV